MSPDGLDGEFEPLARREPRPASKHVVRSAASTAQATRRSPYRSTGIRAGSAGLHAKRRQLPLPAYIPARGIAAEMDGFREAPKGEAHKEIRNVVLLCAVTGRRAYRPFRRGWSPELLPVWRSQ